MASGDLASISFLTTYTFQDFLMPEHPMTRTHLGSTARRFWSAIFRIWSFFLYLFQKQYKTIVEHQTVKYPMAPMGLITSQRLLAVKHKILVLDLDETLIHSTHDGVIRPNVRTGNRAPDFILKVVIERHPVSFFVHKRPHVEFFLQTVSQWYQLVIFTASMEIYGSAVSDKLDCGRNILNRRYFRQGSPLGSGLELMHCTQDSSGYTKDLSSISADLSSIFIIDNSPIAYKGFVHNALPISSWYCDPKDTALLDLLPLLDSLRFIRDVRTVLSRHKNIAAVEEFSAKLQNLRARQTWQDAMVIRDRMQPSVVVDGPSLRQKPSRVPDAGILVFPLYIALWIGCFLIYVFGCLV